MACDDGAELQLQDVVYLLLCEELHLVLIVVINHVEIIYNALIIY